MNRYLALFLAAASVAFASDPVWDTTGNGQLNGTYNFRQVLYISDGSGKINQQIACFGNISFDGAGAYTLSAANTQSNTGTPVSIQPTGTYSVAASGYGFLSNPLIPGASIYFLVSNHILIGSSTETAGSTGAYSNDMFIAAPITPTFTTSTFNGAWTMAGYFPGDGMPAHASNWLFQLNPNGAGTFTSAAITGIVGAAIYNSPYSFSGGVATFAFGGIPWEGPPPDPQFFAGTYTMYLSPDTNFIFGGSPTGFNMVVGVRNPPGSPAARSSSLYYAIGLNEDETRLASNQTSLCTYYGAFNAVQASDAAQILGHERLLCAGSPAENFTYTSGYPGAAPASMSYTIGANNIRIGLGLSVLGIEAAFPMPAPTPAGPAFIDPTGIVDTASSAPFTAGISPGEFITLYNGVNLADSPQCWTTGPPFPTSLVGVQVLIDNIPAPIYCVGSQITAIVPYEVSVSPIASIQVVNNGTNSNVVTAWVHPITPGVFTVPAGGVGPAAAQHADYSLITAASPAQPGETIVVYLSGLGDVTVPPADGSASPSGDSVASGLGVNVAGIASPSISYAGLTPTASGLYQINFRVPLSAPAGNDSLTIVGPGSWSSQTYLAVGTGSNPHVSTSQSRNKPVE